MSAPMSAIGGKPDVLRHRLSDANDPIRTSAGGVELRNIGSGLPCQSGLILAVRITLPHFSVSSAMNFPSSAGEHVYTVAPRSASRAFILGSARAPLISP